ncbi:MAG TPA: adenylate/guanylate cyclase domain-containing protein [Candidatus Dormibacteraeota bacterium]|nr:adenylate/guanylate cyclase domain-containing protein [Candidatus Dormibacteraeota bacterium]
MLRRSVHGFSHLVRTWWRHRASFIISLVITAFAFALYYLVFLQETKTPGFEFLQRLELDSLDTRFRYRSARFTHPDPRISIIDIDQHSQEVLGRFPFTRSYYAQLLDVLREDGARVASFDVTFSKPEINPAIGVLRKNLEATSRQRQNPFSNTNAKNNAKTDPQLAVLLKRLEQDYDADKQFAAAISRFGPVILGNFFFYTQADLRGLDAATLDQYADQLSFFAFPQVIGMRGSLSKADRLFLMQQFASAGLLPKGAEANIAVLTAALKGDASWTGFFNAVPDPDGVVRRATLILPYSRSQDFVDWDLYPSLDVMTVRAFLKLKSEQTILRYSATGIYDLQFGPELRIRPDDLGRAMINYQGPVGSFAHYSLADVVYHKFPPGTFRDKIVLIGATATGIADIKATPYSGSDYPGVEIHANVIDNILNQRFLVRGAKQALIDALLIFSFGIPLGIWLALVNPKWMWFGLGLIVPFIAVNFTAFLHGWWLNFILPLLTIGSNVLLVALYRALVEEKEKRKVRGAFQQYLSPEIIRRLLENPELVQPRKTEITVMFSDVRGFTSISEQLDAQDLALFLNQYLTDMTQIIFAHQGTLDKYIGDAVMAFWGAPFQDHDHRIKACQTALEMMARVRCLQVQWTKEGKPPMDIGIGLHSGAASVGNMGSVLRYGYTAMGDTVNLSSRLEGLNKEYGTHIIVSESTYEGAREAGFVFRGLDLIRVKGKLQPVEIFELIARAKDLPAEGPGSLSEWTERLELFARGRSAYQQRRWNEAQKIFKTLIDRWPDDAPSRMYMVRCLDYLLEGPRSDWDGVFVMTHK